MRSATVVSGLDASSDFTVGSTFRKTSNTNASMSGVVSFPEILSLAFHLIVTADELWSEVRPCLEAQDRDVLRDGDLHYGASLWEDQLSFRFVVRLDLV